MSVPGCNARSSTPTRLTQQDALARRRGHRVRDAGISPLPTSEQPSPHSARNDAESGFVLRPGAGRERSSLRTALLILAAWGTSGDARGLDLVGSQYEFSDAVEDVLAHKAAPWVLPGGGFGVTDGRPLAREAAGGLPGRLPLRRRNVAEYYTVQSTSSFVRASTLPSESRASTRTVSGSSEPASFCSWQVTLPSSSVTCSSESTTP